jgi:glycosyltransferase involved in cell wall biosynthesis
MHLSVIIPTHNPHPARLRRTLLGLGGQQLETDRWETILVNNASASFPAAEFFTSCAPKNLRLITEPTLGLTPARQCGLADARGDFAVFVDDDNVLAPDYLTRVLELFSTHPGVGALGGKSVPEYEQSPPAWAQEFTGLLAVRDLGDRALLSNGLRAPGAAQNRYPVFAPIGAGMALRREAWTVWIERGRETASRISDRRGSSLSSSGDNDIILTVMKAGWEVGYFPDLILTHLIPASRLDPVYLARLNRSIQRSWQQVLALHDASPWPPLSRFGVLLRQARAWFRQSAWASSAGRIRWQGACGHFEGRMRA